MGVFCCVCGKKQGTHGISFHSYPRDPDQRKKWMEACGLTNIKKESRVCSDHFKWNDFSDSLSTFCRRKLKLGVIPTPSNRYKRDFAEISEKQAGLSGEQPGPSEEQPEPCEEQPGSSRELQCATVNGQGPMEINEPERMKEIEHCGDPILEARYIGDLTVAHFSTPRKAKRHLELVKRKVDADRNKIKSFSKKRKQFQKEVESLKELLIQLRDQKVLSDEAARIISKLKRIPEGEKLIGITHITSPYSGGNSWKRRMII
ncbi:hypothetical protein ABEB36_009596 [Hypothenemus hampei]|uniref:THAP-type domain-containing protein n=1 Tax=Hypothenemus hampei TaxID=57062 RepID=A0ABD1EH24_HYPHA